MFRAFAAAALLAGVSAVPVTAGSLSFGAEISLANGVAKSDVTSQLRSVLASAAHFDGAESVEVEVEEAASARRSLQVGATTLQIQYVITCGDSCDEVAATMTAMSAGGAQSEAFAASIISAVNAAAVASGFTNAVLSSPADVAATIAAPDTVSISLPPLPPAPSPPSVGPVQPSALAACPTDYTSTYYWYDVVATGTEVLDTDWANPLNTWNHDDGFLDVPLPFAFMWYQQDEYTVTIGTNGMISFGSAHLRNGGSEPIPCVNLCGNNNYGSHANHADWGIDGVIAPYWADINPGSSMDGVDENGAVFYQAFSDSFVAQWNECTYWTPDNNPTANTFEGIIFSDGGVVFSYMTMSPDHLSWSVESIGYEDASGTQGVQISYGEIPVSGTTYYIPPVCTDFPTPPPVVSNDPVQPPALAACPTDYTSDYYWYDISTTGTEIMDDQWSNPLNTWNHDDGFVDVPLPFAFMWYQQEEPTVTIGTNGMLSFGTAHLRNGGSEPIPCINLCGNNNYGSHANHADWGIDGVIAPYWADINPGSSLDGVDENGAVFHQVFSASFIAQWNECTYWTPDNNPTAQTFEAILFSDGGVVFSYKTMSPDHLSWSVESVGYEDGSGTQGVQISYGEIPVSGTTYYIPPVCTDFPTPPPVDMDAPVELSDAPTCPNRGYVNIGTGSAVWPEFFDISGSGTEIMDDQWVNPLNTWNHDDGFMDVALPFAFMWYQLEEPTVTIGTNGVLSFGTAHLRNGGSEPIPCINLCGNNNYGSHANHADWGIDGVIAPYWADINPGSSLDGVDEDGAVFFQVYAGAVVVQWNQVTYWTPDNNPTANTFEAVLWQDGGVIFSYMDMSQEHLSWSVESVGYEDSSGTLGYQIWYGEIPFSGDTYWIPPVCTDMPTGVPTGVVTVPAVPSAWPRTVCPASYDDYVVDTYFVDILPQGVQIQDDQWANPLNTWNHDDGYVDVPLPWAFPWYGLMENTITIGTNGMITFGTGHLRNGGSEPIPCLSVNLCDGNSYGSHANHADWGVDGVIAPFWADINPGSSLDGVDEDGAVYYMIFEDSAAVTWNQCTYWTPDNNPTAQTFQAILFADASVIFSYFDMAPEAGHLSWSEESIGYEDSTGTTGYQIAYSFTADPNAIPADGTTFYIPPVCTMESTIPGLPCATNADCGVGITGLFCHLSSPTEGVCNTCEAILPQATATDTYGCQWALGMDWYPLCEEQCSHPTVINPPPTPPPAPPPAPPGGGNLGIGEVCTFSNECAGAAFCKYQASTTSGTCYFCGSIADFGTATDPTGCSNQGLVNIPECWAGCDPNYAPPPAPPAASSEFVTPVVTAIAGAPGGWDTYQLSVTLSASAANVYTISATTETPMSLPAAYQVPAPFGADIGGVSPAFFAIANNAALGFAEFDSWLTVGMTDASNPGALSASPR
eukprot:COSAG06_NODE_3445_length_5332_cov_5.351424_3_plen_1421_part_00